MEEDWVVLCRTLHQALGMVYQALGMGGRGNGETSMRVDKMDRDTAGNMLDLHDEIATLATPSLESARESRRTSVSDPRRVAMIERVL